MHDFARRDGRHWSTSHRTDLRARTKIDRALFLAPAGIEALGELAPVQVIRASLPPDRLDMQRRMSQAVADSQRACAESKRLQLWADKFRGKT